MRIAILGATSQIARDLVLSFVRSGAPDELLLFARRPDAISAWLESQGQTGRFPVSTFATFGNGDYDAIVNFVGVGDPARALAMGSTIFDLTLEFDQLALDYQNRHHHCRYLFLSSGAAYGGSFEEPVRRSTNAVVCANDLQPQAWYGAAKLNAECRHRSLVERPIIDIRVFSYFSRTQDLSARFLLTDIVRSIRDGSVLKIAPERIVRDYLHPVDFHNLVRALLSSPVANAAVDCYTRAPIDKPALLAAMEQRFGLRYEIVGEPVAVNATGTKPHYYSLNDRAADFGYAPTRTSIDGIIEETAALLDRTGVRGAPPR